MKLVIYHIVLPLVVCLLFFAVAYSPVSLFGCAGRGTIATAIALASGAGAMVCVVRGKNALQADPAMSRWWLMSTVILAAPVVGLLVLA